MRYVIVGLCLSLLFSAYSPSKNSFSASVHLRRVLRFPSEKGQILPFFEKQSPCVVFPFVSTRSCCAGKPCEEERESFTVLPLHVPLDLQKEDINLLSILWYDGSVLDSDRDALHCWQMQECRGCLVFAHAHYQGFDVVLLLLAKGIRPQTHTL